MNNMNIIITGSNGSVGKELVQLLQNKFQNIIGIERNEKTNHHNIHYFSCQDLSDPILANNTFNQIFNQFNQIHGLINVAGGFTMGNNTEDVKDWDYMIKINFNTMLNATINLLPHMKNNQYGRIINFGSDAAYNGMALATPYCVSKAAVQSFTQSLSLELFPDITCNALIPSIINTKINQKAMPESDYSKWVQIDQICNKITDIFKNNYSGKLLSFAD